MGRPQNKAELIDAANTNYEKLFQIIDSMTEEELNTPFDFSDDDKKKEAHWKRDKNLRDVLMHLHEWHKLVLDWVENNRAGIKKPFLPEGYNWRTYGDMNILFWKNCQNVSLEKAKKLFQESHEKVMTAIEAIPSEELFSKSVYDWVGGSTLGSYYISTTSSHYDWAIKKIKAHRKRLNGK